MKYMGNWKVAAVLKFKKIDCGHTHTYWDAAVYEVNRGCYEWFSNLEASARLDTYMGLRAWLLEDLGIHLPQAQDLEKQGVDADGTVYYTTRADDIYYCGLRGTRSKTYWIGEKEGLDCLYGSLPATADVRYK